MRGNLIPAGLDGLAAMDRRHQRHQHPCHWVWTGYSQVECSEWTGYKRDCEHNGRQQSCTLGSMWRSGLPGLTPHAYILIADTIVTRTLVMSKSESRLKQLRSTVRLSAVVTTLADSQRRMQTSGRSRDSRAGIFFPNLNWAHDSGVI